MRPFRALSLAFALAGASFAVPAQSPHQPPALPPGCESLAVPAGNKVAGHVFAFGVQVYRWNAGTATWDFVEPSAILIGHAGFQGVTGIHYAGPTWQTTNGSRVTGARVAGCSPAPNAIPWLLLRGVTSQGPDLLKDTTYIQRVKTTGGLAPGRAGTPGEIVGVQYTAEYYFYRAG
jgi:hypothetical protein